MTLLHQAAQKAVEALEMARTGLQWYRGMMPEYVDGSDGEADEEIQAALSALESALQQQEVPREPVAQIRGGDLYWLVAGNEKLPEGALLYASPSTTQQQEAGNDTRRLDWLSLQLVSVRAHLRYGSKFLFSSLSNHDEEDGITPGPLRVLIDKAMPAAPSTPESAEKDDAGGGKEVDRG